MNEENNKCDKCDLVATKLYRMVIKKGDKVRRMQLCRFCRKDIKTKKKFTREKVKHDYEGVFELIKKYHEEAGTPLRIEVTRK